MNFFKSILSDDPDPSDAENPKQSSPSSSTSDNEIDPSRDRDPSAESETADTADTADTAVGGWNFGGLIKTLATRSESVIDTYRRDLQEFGTGLKKETVIFREVASRAVKELPASIEVGASVAHGAIDGVIKSTAEIISHGKETLLSSSDVDPETPSGLVSGYSRFEARLSAIQNDLNTFCEEPEDSEEYKKWKSGFILGEKSEEVENLIGENGALEGVYKRVVPNSVDDGTFWYRYFYRVYKLMQQESVRASLVKRAISIDEEEELSWDVDDDEYEEDESESEKKEHSNPTPSAMVEKEASSNESQEESDKSLHHDVQKETEAELIKHIGSGEESTNLEGEKQVKNEDGVAVEEDKKEVISEEGKGDVSSKQVKNEDGVAVKEDKKEVISEEGKGDVSSRVSDNKKEVISEEGKGDVSSRVSDKKVVHGEEEMGWDEIEDMGSDDDDKKESSTSSGGKTNSDDVRKRLSAAEEDEDLSWDIEDDD